MTHSIRISYQIDGKDEGRYITVWPVAEDIPLNLALRNAVASCSSHFLENLGKETMLPRPEDSK